MCEMVSERPRMQSAWIWHYVIDDLIGFAFLRIIGLADRELGLDSCPAQGRLHSLITSLVLQGENDASRRSGVRPQPYASSVLWSAFPATPRAVSTFYHTRFNALACNPSVLEWGRRASRVFPLQQVLLHCLISRSSPHNFDHRSGSRLHRVSSPDGFLKIVDGRGVKVVVFVVQVQKLRRLGGCLEH